MISVFFARVASVVGGVLAGALFTRLRALLPGSAKHPSPMTRKPAAARSNVGDDA